MTFENATTAALPLVLYNTTNTMRTRTGKSHYALKQATKIPHGRQKDFFKHPDCITQASGICPHGQRKTRCKHPDCIGRGGAMCSHGRRKDFCKQTKVILPMRAVAAPTVSGRRDANTLSVSDRPAPSVNMADKKTFASTQIVLPTQAVSVFMASARQDAQFLPHWTKGYRTVPFLQAAQWLAGEVVAGLLSAAAANGTGPEQRPLK